MDQSKNIVKIRYASDETGWAEMVGPLRARIDNVPMTSALNVDDVVMLQANGERLDTVVRLIERPFPMKAVVEYRPMNRSSYMRLYTAFETAGMKCEGAVPGTMVVAYAKGDLDKIAMKAGIEVLVQPIELTKPEERL